ncbi:hypothetical protein [Methylophaga thiooxydans]|uniref:hypothetical protein n=1 Tax=Methylophaga thiooxydans TaxID=392484 RepID=UPI002352906A|nr:hypothetical protein [Methylophaga thiooxydans]
MTPKQPNSCREYGQCLLLADLENYIDKDLFSERAKLLVQHGTNQGTGGQGFGTLMNIIGAVGDVGR